MELWEKLKKTKEVYDGKLLHVYCDVVELPNGGESIREIVRHPGGACVCAIDKELKVTFVRQYRYPYGMEVLELPAGKLDKKEEPYDAALRELREEAGLTVETLLPLGELFPSPGYTDEIINMYLAINAEPCEQSLDDDEFLNVEKIYIGDAIDMVLRGEIRDAKTQVCLLKSYIVIDGLGSQIEGV